MKERFEGYWKGKGQDSRKKKRRIKTGKKYGEGKLCKNGRRKKGIKIKCKVEKWKRRGIWKMERKKGRRGI